MLPSDWNLLGIFLKQKFYVDTGLPLGLSSAPHLFNHLSIALHWILEQNYGVDHMLHYLDQFFTAGPADSRTCEENLYVMLALCDRLNVPITPLTVQLKCNLIPACVCPAEHTRAQVTLPVTSLQAPVTFAPFKGKKRLCGARVKSFYPRHKYP